MALGADGSVVRGVPPHVAFVVGPSVYHLRSYAMPEQWFQRSFHRSRHSWNRLHRIVLPPIRRDANARSFAVIVPGSHPARRAARPTDRTSRPWPRLRPCLPRRRMLHTIQQSAAFESSRWSIMAKYLISFPSKAMVVPQGALEAVGRRCDQELRVFGFDPRS